MKKIFLAIAMLGISLPQHAAADQYSGHQHSSASSHGPISVMGDHLHRKGEWMTSYRYMRMAMDGNRTGSRRISAREIVGAPGAAGQFLVAPTRMPMDMHMVGVMYGWSDRVTLVGMASYLSNEMDHLIRNGRTFTTTSSGIGDTKIGALVGIYQNINHSLHLNLGLSLPTGSTDERDDTPAMANAVLPYPMQIGSGTYDLQPGITYRGRQNKISWGAQATAVLRLDDNSDSYTLGDHAFVNSWLAYDLNRHLSVSAALKYQDRGNIDGANPALNPAIVQTANTDLQAGQRLDGSLGLNYLFANGHRLALEYALPLSQDLDGPQLEVDSVFTIGWQKAF